MKYRNRPQVGDAQWNPESVKRHSEQEPIHEELDFLAKPKYRHNPVVSHYQSL